MKLQPLTASEEDVMRMIWEKESIYFRDLMSAYPEPKPHQNTVSTFLKILVEKHYLNAEKQGRIYLYSPAVSWQDYKKIVTKKFVENYFENSGSELLQLMMDENLIQPEDWNPADALKNATLPKAQSRTMDPVRELVKELTGKKKSKKKDKDKKKKKTK